MRVPASACDTTNLKGIDLADIQAMRLILRGHSVVDWHRLNLHTTKDVERFLSVNRYDASLERDQERLRRLLNESVRYLENNFHYHFPDEIKKPGSVIGPFLLASSSSEYQNLACIVLKVMHIINHIEARELRYRLPVSEDTLYKQAEEAVNRVVANLVASKVPITSYKASRKSRDSLVTKLLAKKNSLASQVFDRLRFRIVTKTSLDILRILAFLKNNLLPYNYVVPGESRNEILDFQDVIEAVPRLKLYAHQLQYHFQIEEAVAVDELNKFSSSDFRMINFVVDMPLRVDAIVEEAGKPGLGTLGHVVFILVEFQIFDEETNRFNEQGDASHENYKERQRWEVIRRLVYGAQGAVGDNPGLGGKTRH